LLQHQFSTTEIPNTLKLPTGRLSHTSSMLLHILISLIITQVSWNKNTKWLRTFRSNV